jgi:hypothetical protein
MLGQRCTRYRFMRGQMEPLGSRPGLSPMRLAPVLSAHRFVGSYATFELQNPRAVSDRFRLASVGHQTTCQLSLPLRSIPECQHRIEFDECPRLHESRA